VSFATITPCFPLRLNICLLLCIISAVHGFAMADLKEYQFVLSFASCSGATASGTLEMKCGFTFMNQKPNSNFFSRKSHPLLSGECRASQAKHQELVGDILLSLRALYSRNVPPGCTVNEHY